MSMTAEEVAEILQDNNALPLSDALTGSLVKLDFLPADMIGLPSDLSDFLDQAGIANFDLKTSKNDDGSYSSSASVDLVLAQQITLDVPGLDGFTLVVGENDAQKGTTIALGLDWGQEYAFHVGAKFALRFSPRMVKPVEWKNNAWSEVKDKQAEIAFDAEITIDGDGNITFGDKSHPAGDISLSPCMISDSGFILHGGFAGDAGKSHGDASSRTGAVQPITVKLILSDTAAKAVGLADGWRGVHIAKVVLEMPDSLRDMGVPIVEIEDCSIGNGGFSGDFKLEWAKDHALTGSVGGFSAKLIKIEADFKQNALAKAGIEGILTVPFFDSPVDVEIGFTLDGAFSVSLTGEKALWKIEKENVASISVDHIGFEKTKDDFIFKIGGSLQPKFGGYDNWPGFKIKELAINSKGDVHLDGGWLVLPDKYAVDFHGFKFEISKLGFGQEDDGSKWIGFSGGIRLIDALPAGVSVEGLRLTWKPSVADPTHNDYHVSFEGIGIEFEIPETLKFSGKVAYKKIEDTSGVTHRFDGEIKLDVTCVSLLIDAKLVVGIHEAGGFFFAIFIGVDLPAGIPLGSTPLALYGIAGLFAMHMEPDKTAEMEWFSELGTEPGWYQKKPKGVNGLEKWREQHGSFALGGGITIGTVYDNGYTFSGKMLLVLVFPGPIIILEGLTNIFKERKKLDESPVFRTLAVLDFREGSFVFGLTVDFNYGDKGELVTLGGSAEIYYSGANPDAWHVWIGKNDPRDKRIHAKIFQLFGAEFYLMVDSKSFAMGSWVGYQADWEFGPVKLIIEAWLEWNVRVNFKPAQLHGDIWMHGKLAIQIGPIGLALTGDAKLEADIFKPNHILGTMDVAVKLPWPLPSFSADVKLEWGPDPVPPPIPKPLAQLALEHPKSTISWPLPTGSLMLPVYEVVKDKVIAAETAGFLDTLDQAELTARALAQESADPPLEMPTVPLDVRPRLTFSRPVGDAQYLGGGRPALDPEMVGDPAKKQGSALVQYSLNFVKMRKWRGKGLGWDATGDQVYGTWTALPEVPAKSPPASAQSSLGVYQLNPFNFMGANSQVWGNWFSDTYCPGFPCPPPTPQDVEVTCDFNGEDLSTHVPSPWTFRARPDLTLYWAAVPDVSIVRDASVSRRVMTFVHEADAQVTILLPEPANRVTVGLTKPDRADLTGFDADGVVYPSGVTLDSRVVDAGTGKISRLVLTLKGDRNQSGALVPVNVSSVTKISYLLRLSLDTPSWLPDLEKHLSQLAHRWTEKGAILQPYTTYSIHVQTQVNVTGLGSIADFHPSVTVDEFAYFRTDGPPGLAKLTAPASTRPATGGDADNHELPSAGNFDSGQAGLGDLTKYVAQTVPVTVPANPTAQILPAAVYRAYDVGVVYNENYVDLMYRASSRDLGLYLFDSNQRPVRDMAGRLVAPVNYWGEAEQISLTNTDSFWLKVMNNGCMQLNKFMIKKPVSLAASGFLLNASTAYEARLVPFLLHDELQEFDKADITGPNKSLGGWTCRNEAPLIINEIQTYSEWKVLSDTQAAKDSKETITTYTLTQVSPYSMGSADHPQGSILWYEPGKPAEWADYRFSATLRTADYALSDRRQGGIGVVFRFSADDKGLQSYFLFLMNNVDGQTFRRLYRVSKGVHAVVAQSAGSYQSNLDYRVVVEAIESDIRIYVGDELVFAVTEVFTDKNKDLKAGSIGLYSWYNTAAHFTNVRVEDLRKLAPVVYRFRFSTSKYANFYHHLHSYQEELWTVPALALRPAELASAAAESAPVTSDEGLSYESLASHLLGASAMQNPAELQMYAFDLATAADPTVAEPIAILLRSPEPIDWARTSFQLTLKPVVPIEATVPGPVKMTESTLAADGAPLNNETVTLLLREDRDLTGYRIEYRAASMFGQSEVAKWLPYYTFGAEELQPAGSVIVIHAGHTEDWAASFDGKQHRFLQLKKEDVVRLPATGYDFRIVGGQSRTFLPNGTSPVVDVPRVLRKADGTGCFLVPSTAAAFTPGQYDLTVTYRRDNTAADAASVVLRQANDSSDEVATLTLHLSLVALPAVPPPVSTVAPASPPEEIFGLVPVGGEPGPVHAHHDRHLRHQHRRIPHLPSLDD